MNLYFYTKPEAKVSRFSFAGVFDETSRTLKIGVAQCNKKDTFVKKFGKTIAEARATKRPIEVLQLSNDVTLGKAFVEYCNTYYNQYKTKLFKI